MLTCCSFGAALSPSGSIFIDQVRPILTVSSPRSDAIYVHYTENPSPGLGAQIIEAIGPSFLSRGSEDARILKICSAMHAVLVSELRFYSGEEESDGRESHLQRIITTYVLFAPSSIGKSASVQYF